MDTEEVLMSPTNPDGWKLEELLSVLRDEIVLKCDKIKDDPRDVAQRVLHNNRTILGLLASAEKIQRESMALLDAFRPNDGPTGTPRIGVGSPP